ncbi:hypothetical protein BC332_33066 [Capsicum chinense]|nr:hypothetical protein BC332_33066 [Capsicum chinense]
MRRGRATGPDEIPVDFWKCTGGADTALSDFAPEIQDNHLLFHATECKRGMFGSNRCVIAYRFGVGLGSERVVGQNRPSCLKKAGERPSVGLWDGRGGLGGQTGEMVQTEQFGAKSVCYSPRFRGRSGVRAYCGLKIDWGVPGRLGSGLVWSIGVGGAIWVVKWAKRQKRAIFSLIRNAQTRQLSHPLPVLRAREIDEWSRSQEYRSLLQRAIQIRAEKLLLKLGRAFILARSASLLLAKQDGI